MIKLLDTKGAALKRQASRAVNAIGQRITAIEKACAHTVTNLTAQLTEQCRTFHDTLQSFKEQICIVEAEMDAIKQCN
jgi:CII-binding regulator of phage lambda lysogenization HflD